MRQIVLNVPEGLLEAVSRLVQKGYYPNRAEAIRFAMRLLVDDHGDRNLPIAIPPYTGKKDIQDLFEKFLREGKAVCPLDCPQHKNCYVEPGCFQRVLIDFIFWLKEKIHRMNPNEG